MFWVYCAALWSALDNFNVLYLINNDDMIQVFCNENLPFVHFERFGQYF